MSFTSSRIFPAVASLVFAAAACAPPDVEAPPVNVLAYGDPPPKAKAEAGTPAPAVLDGASTTTDQGISSVADQPRITSVTYFARDEGLPAYQAHLLGTLSHLFPEIAIENPTSHKVQVELRGALQGFTVADAVATRDLAPGEKVKGFLDGTLDFQKLDAVSAPTNATYAVQLLVDGKVVSAFSQVIRVLPKSTVFWTGADPKKIDPIELGVVVGSLTTPHDSWKEVDKLLRAAAPRSARGALVGYQYQTPTSTLDADAAGASDQLAALYATLAASGYVYTSVAQDFFAGSQTVRFPSESLRNKSGNCIDGSLVFASALEAIGMAPFVVFVPGHAFVGVHIGKKGTPSWDSAFFVETTVLSTTPFQQAIQLGLQRWNTTPATDKIVIEVEDLRAKGFLPSPLPI